MDGHPLAGAWIEHTAARSKEPVTDQDGHFEFSTYAPAFVVRTPGYESAFLLSHTAQSVRVPLKKNTSTIPDCSKKIPCTSLTFGDTVFCFPPVRGVQVLDQGNDIDYGQRDYTVRSNHGRQGIRHGGGALWGPGMPFDEDVWTSIEYSEKTYTYGPSFIVDVRGKTESGKFWRSIGTSGETATYRDVDQEWAILLDKVLDGMCIREEKHK